MLIEFRVANFRSFKEEQTLSLVAGRDKKHKESLINAGPFRLLKTAAVYGANASGKSNLFRAFKVMSDFVSYSATRMNQGDSIPGIVPFRLSSETQSKPSCFAVLLLVKENLYEYSFEATETKVWRECLTVSAPSGARRKTCFERRFCESSGAYEWTSDVLSPDDEEALRKRTRENGLALSRGAEQNVKPLGDLFAAFDKNTWFFSLSDRPVPLMDATARRVRKSPEFAKRVETLLRDADFGIHRVAVEDGPPPSPKVLDLLRKILSKEAAEKMESEGVLASGPQRIYTEHHMCDSPEPVRFAMDEDESSGTQHFFALVGPILDALDKGALVVVDEIDCSMHSLLTWKIVEFFHHADSRAGGAQLLFTTQDSTLMHSALLRRDQVWLVEKNKKGASQLLSLYDFSKKGRPRGSTAFQRNYLAGRYGGVPMFGPTLEDMGDL